MDLLYIIELVLRGVVLVWLFLVPVAIYVSYLAIQERRIRKKNERALAAIRRAGEEFAKKYPPKGDRK